MAIDTALDPVRGYLHSRYAGVFDAATIERHIRDHVGFGDAEQLTPWVMRHVPQGGKILDIGSGFGSFVLACRRLGFDAVGLELTPFEVEYARERLKVARPEEDATLVYRLGDGRQLPFEPESFDAVTLWNVLEHVPDSHRVLAQAKQVLKPNGVLFIICPNYAALRDEAHYHVFWFSLMPKRIGAWYLTRRGKDPRFLQTAIFYRTNWGVLAGLRELGFHALDPNAPARTGDPPTVQYLTERIRAPETVSAPGKRRLLFSLQRLRLGGFLIFAVKGLFGFREWSGRVARTLRFYNPFKNSVILCARKGAD